MKVKPEDMMKLKKACDMAEKKLVPCSCCQEKPRIQIEYGDKKPWFQFYCEMYACNNPITMVGDDLDQMVKDWNEYMTRKDGDENDQVEP